MIEVVSPYYPLPHQLEAHLWEPGDPTKLTIRVGLGAWGAGKTQWAAAQMIAVLSHHTWVMDYGKKRPIALLIAPTVSHAREEMFDAIKFVAPDIIVDERGMPNPHLLLQNGVKIEAHAASSKRWEGRTAVAVWPDEIQESEWSAYPGRYTKAVARARDPIAVKYGRPREVIVTGRPTHGFVRDLFDESLNDAQFKTWRWSLEQNTRIPRDVYDATLRSCPAGMADHLLRGAWGHIEHALYPQYDGRKHLTDLDGDPRRPCDVGLDVGNRSAGIIGQVIEGRFEDWPIRNARGDAIADSRVLIVDEVLGDGLSLGELAIAVRDRGWRIEAGRSRIFVDPTLRRDEIGAVSKVFPGVDIVIRGRADDFHDVKRGVRLVQAALRDSTGSIRLKFVRRLSTNERGVVESMTTLRANPRTGAPVVDDQRDHPNDACRYLVCGVLGALTLAPEIMR